MPVEMMAAARWQGVTIRGRSWWPCFRLVNRIELLEKYPCAILVRLLVADVIPDKLAGRLVVNGVVLYPYFCISQWENGHLYPRSPCYFVSLSLC
jgi:hypothetical protein